jgi:hypothetical protein
MKLKEADDNPLKNFKIQVPPTSPHWKIILKVDNYG